MRAIPKIEWQYNGILLHEEIKPLEEWAIEAKLELIIRAEAIEGWKSSFKEAEKKIKQLTEGLTTIISLGSRTGNSGEQFLADIAVGTLNKTNK